MATGKDIIIPFNASNMFTPLIKSFIKIYYYILLFNYSNKGDSIPKSMIRLGSSSPNETQKVILMS